MLRAASDFENCRTLFAVLILHICFLYLDSGKLFFEEYYKRKKFHLEWKLIQRTSDHGGYFLGLHSTMSWGGIRIVKLFNVSFVNVLIEYIYSFQVIPQSCKMKQLSVPIPRTYASTLWIKQIPKDKFESKSWLSRANNPNKNNYVCQINLRRDMKSLQIYHNLIHKMH